MIGIPNFGLGFAAGFGVGFVTRDLASASESMVRPFVKFLVKSSMRAMEKTKETMAHFSESFDDLVAEARTEVEIEAHEIPQADHNIAAINAEVAETVAVDNDGFGAAPRQTAHRAKRSKHRGRRAS